MLRTAVVLVATASMAIAGTYLKALEQYVGLEANIPIPSPFTRVNITSHDGIVLEAIVFDTKVPKKTQPAIVFITSWGMPKYEYLEPAKKFSDLGYTVVSYTARGFWGSSQRRDQPGGQIDLAREKDVKDVSAVIDWMLANTHADPKRIGASGISYGGGISILASAKEPRIRSVVAMSCWVDLAESLLGQGNTIRKEAARELQILAELTGTVSPDLQYLFDNYFANTNIDKLRELVQESSAVNVIEEIKKNNPSIFIANAFGDSLFTPNQFPSFFTALTNPKHLEFAPGDHAGAELSGLFPQITNASKLFGTPGLVWERAFSWFDYYLMQANTGTFEEMPTIIFNTLTTNNTLDTYNSWAEVTKSVKKFSLSSRENLSPMRKAADGGDAVQPVGAWNDVATITTGWSTISGGIALVTNTVEAVVDHNRPWLIKDIDRTFGAVFLSSKGDLGSGTAFIRGVPHLSLDIVPSESSGTLVVYLLDVLEEVKLVQLGQLITFAPYSFTGAKKGKSMTIEMDLTMTSWNLANDRRLALVVATKDNLFLDQNPNKASITIGDGSVLQIPLH